MKSTGIVTSRLAVALTLVLCMTVPVFAHFQMVMPDRNIVSQEGGRDIHLSLLFTHPFEQHPMNMEKPAAFGVFSRGETTDLLASLKEIDLGEGLKGWETDYTIKKPGDHIFFVEPIPYWEPAEDCYIVHLTKTVVNAFGMEEGWDQPIGLQAEIIPLTRPYGLWAGNIFQGKVLVEGNPAAGVEVEVEFYNDKESVQAPSDSFITQVVMTDDEGIFSYVMPWEGWWGFAALTEGSQSMKSPDNRDVSLELGAVLWVRTEAP